MAIPPKASKILAAVMIVSGAAWTTVWVQAQGQSQALGASAGGSLTELTAEVRQLRVSIEGAGRTQLQVSALGMALTTQQVRLSQLAARLDKLDDARGRVGEDPGGRSDPGSPSEGARSHVDR